MDFPDTLPTFGGHQETQKPAELILENKKKNDKMLVGELCNMIRDNCHEDDIVRLLNQYQIEEARVMNMVKNQIAHNEGQIDSKNKMTMTMP